MQTATIFFYYKVRQSGMIHNKVRQLLQVRWLLKSAPEQDFSSL